MFNDGAATLPPENEVHGESEQVEKARRNTRWTDKTLIDCLPTNNGIRHNDKLTMLRIGRFASPQDCFRAGAEFMKSTDRNVETKLDRTARQSTGGPHNTLGYA